MAVLAALQQCFHDVRTLTLFALIVADLVLGIAAALRSGSFDLQKLARTNTTNVVPYLLGYFLVYTLNALGLAPLLTPFLGPELAADLAPTGWFMLLATSLGGSLARHLLTLRQGPPAPAVER